MLHYHLRPEQGQGNGGSQGELPLIQAREIGIAEVHALLYASQGRRRDDAWIAWSALCRAWGGDMAMLFL
jgi:hypothetical protein